MSATADVWDECDMGAPACEAVCPIAGTETKATRSRKVGRIYREVGVNLNYTGDSDRAALSGRKVFCAGCDWIARPDASPILTISRSDPSQGVV